MFAAPPPQRRSRPSRLRHARRPAAAALAIGLAASALAACGGDDSEVPEGAVRGLDAVEVTGEPGSSPEVEWSGEMAATELETEVLVEGDGAELEQGDQAFAHLYVGNGFAQEQALSTYDTERPEVLTVSDQLTPAIVAAMDGQKVGSRVAVAAPPEEAFGENGNPQLGIGNQDSVLFIVDILGDVLPEADGTERKPRGPVPRVVSAEGTPSRLEFPPGLRATGTLQKQVLIQGDGDPVTNDSYLAVRYLGQVLGNDRPFDESFSAADPSVLDINGVVRGWTRGLRGVKVGSRVSLVIPPQLGYGKQGQTDAGIKGDDTLVFVIDVLGVS